MVNSLGSRDISRRDFLQVVGASGLAAFGGEALALGPALTAPMIGNMTALRGAMHVHTSFSEGTASLHSQLEEAARNGFDVFWPTDHDWRMSAHRAPREFHFTGLTEVVEGGSYTWKPATSGSLASSSTGIVSAPTSPADPSGSKGSLKVEATSSGSAAASRRCLMDGIAANKCQRTNVAGQQLLLDVFPDLIGPNAWAEVLITLSYRPATAGRLAGSCQLSYRVGTAAPSRTAQGLLGVVTIQAPPGAFTTLTLDMASDIAAIWPDIVATDNALVDLRLGVTSQAKTLARAYFGYLRFNRTSTAGDQPLQTQSDMVRQYVEQYPRLAVGRGVEVSTSSEHVNWFGGEQHLIQHQTTKPTDIVAYASNLIHQGGGLAALNHPFGSGTGALVSQAQQDTQRRSVASRFLNREVGGVDIVESGFRQRSGMGLETHLGLFDTFIRNGFWVTATGVNDNHAGTSGSWAKDPNRFFTTTWAASSSEADLLAALRRGQVFVGELGAFNGYLNASVEGNPMGSVSIKPGARSRELTVTALDLSTGSYVEVVRGPVDYSNSLDPGTAVVTTLPSTAFTAGQATVGIDATQSCFVRLNVVDATGRRVAFSNPVMLLQSEPARPLPDYRRAPDSPPVSSAL
ncbi:MAG: CehA/McbA family metallohydrolase [Nocardioides sp.]|nr:CehA/McbA family metallohydrolase [Nocardioides sp.]